MRYRNKMRKQRLLLIAVLCMTLLFVACGKEEKGSSSSISSSQIDQFSDTDFVMDTVLSVTTYSEENESAAIKTLLEELEKKELSWREEESMASRINTGCNQGNSVTMDPAFAKWTDNCLTLADRSFGAFDPTIGTLTRLWNIEGENPKVPAQAEIDQCLSKIGYEHIYIEEREISMDEGITLDLGAVGKGIGCDEVSSYIKEKTKESEIQGAVVAIGGSIVVYGQKPDGSKWNIAVQDPEKEDGVPMGVISLSGEHYISTSGDYEKFFEENGKKYHHILNPKTGYPTENELTSVTIVCDNGLLSDGLSTACFVLGSKKGLELIQSYGAEAILIRKDKTVLVTDGLKKDFQIIEDSYKNGEE